jgi:hypothetical protein
VLTAGHPPNECQSQFKCRANGLRRLTFELTGPMRRDGLARAAKMYCVPQAGPRQPAVAGPVVQRGVRRQFLVTLMLAISEPPRPNVVGLETKSCP